MPLLNDVKLFGIVIEEILLQPQNAYSSMEVTLLGIITVDKFVQLLKALSPIETRLLDIVTEVNLGQL